MLESSAPDSFPMDRTALIQAGVSEIMRRNVRTQCAALVGRGGDYMATFKLRGTQLTIGLHPHRGYITIHANSLANVRTALLEIRELIQILKDEHPEWLNAVKIKSFLLANSSRRQNFARVITRGKLPYTDTQDATPYFIQAAAFLDLNARWMLGFAGNRAMPWGNLAQVGEIVVDLRG